MLSVRFLKAFGQLDWDVVLDSCEVGVSFEVLESLLGDILTHIAKDYESYL